MVYKIRTEGGSEFVTSGAAEAAALPTDFRALGMDKVRRLGDIPFRTTWRVALGEGGDDWGRVLTTSTQRSIPLPRQTDAEVYPETKNRRLSAALYIEPSLRRLCAAVDELSQGLWEKIIFAGSRALVGELRENSLGFEELYSSPFGEVALASDASAALVAHHDPSADIQLVCFDGIDDSMHSLVMADIVRGAEQYLSSGGLLMLGGTLHSCVGRQSLAETVNLALRYFEPECEQERPLNGGVAFQTVFRK